jgi:hypothetical protein
MHCTYSASDAESTLRQHAYTLWQRSSTLSCTLSDMCITNGHLLAGRNGAVEARNRPANRGLGCRPH